MRTLPALGALALLGVAWLGGAALLGCVFVATLAWRNRGEK